jgi:hypothetical protein
VFDHERCDVVGAEGSLRGGDNLAIRNVSEWSRAQQLAT